MNKKDKSTMKQCMQIKQNGISVSLRRELNKTVKSFTDCYMDLHKIVCPYDVGQKFTPSNRSKVCSGFIGVKRAHHKM